MATHFADDTILTLLFVQMFEQSSLIARQAQELARLIAENQQLKTENDQLKTENQQLKTENDQLKTENQQLKEQNQELQNRLALNSHNSHKPPASDGFHKPNSGQKRSKTSTAKKVGGQPGHEGRTLKAVEQPDHTVVHPVCACANCRRDLQDVPAAAHQKRQVFDLPPVKIEVTEHQAEVKRCPDCGHTSVANFPADVTQPVQYGPCLTSIGIYLMDYQLLPYERAAEAMEDLFDCSISAGTLFTSRVKCADHLTGFEQVVKEQIVQADVAHFDETGLSVNGKNQWLHTASTPDLTWYGVHAKRGTVAMTEFDILPRFKGTAVHDFFASYLQFDCDHGQCNAHILRELTRAAEQEQAAWAAEMDACLHDFKRTVEAAKENGLTGLHPSLILQMEGRYQNIVDRASQTYPPPDPNPVKKKGRRKQSFAKNLLDRLKNYRPEILRFITDFNVPFDNNLAERDLRMMKVKQKISGTFRSQQGASMFCRIRGYISTARKQTRNVLNAIYAAIRNTPFMPE